jgi:hypothetical protein
LPRCHVDDDDVGGRRGNQRERLGPVRRRANDGQVLAGGEVPVHALAVETHIGHDHDPHRRIDHPGSARLALDG